MNRRMALDTAGIDTARRRDPSSAGRVAVGIGHDPAA
jgi:hypothetical protein